MAAALRANNIDARVVDTREEARRLVLELVPEGAEVHSGRSKTIEDVGLYRDLFESGRYDSVRARAQKMDRQTQGREIRKLMAPDYMLGSVQAITAPATWSSRPHRQASSDPMPARPAG